MNKYIDEMEKKILQSSPEILREVADEIEVEIFARLSPRAQARLEEIYREDECNV